MKDGEEHTAVAKGRREEGGIKGWQLIHAPSSLLLVEYKRVGVGGGGCLVGFHPSLARYWQEHKAPYKDTHIHTHTRVQ